MTFVGRRGAIQFLGNGTLVSEICSEVCQPAEGLARLLTRLPAETSAEK